MSRSYIALQRILLLSQVDSINCRALGVTDARVKIRYLLVCARARARKIDTSIVYGHLEITLFTIRAVPRQ